MRLTFTDLTPPHYPYCCILPLSSLPRLQSPALKVVTPLHELALNVSSNLPGTPTLTDSLEAAEVAIEDHDILPDSSDPTIEDAFKS
jgi:hypothetical protein